MAKDWCISCVFIFVLIIFIPMSFGSSLFTQPVDPEAPYVILTDSSGKQANEFGIMGSMAASFSRLLPDTSYEVQVIRSDGKVISHAAFSSDRAGIIPTTVLWWDIGADYSGSRSGRLDMKMLFNYGYACQVKRNGHVIFEIPIRIKPLAGTGPVIFACDADGSPLNGFVRGKENVYLRGMNFPQGCKGGIYVTADRDRRDAGDPFENLLEQDLYFRLEENQKDFIILAWHADLTEIGNYDFIVRYTPRNKGCAAGIVTDSGRGPGFRVFPAPAPSSAGKQLEADLTCQTPPRDPETGFVFDPPGPLYKDAFAPGEEIWLALRTCAGGRPFTGENARLYIVPNRTEAEWRDGLFLQDVSSDGYETVIVQPGAGGIYSTRIWQEPIPRADGYDVVVDFTPFGIYNRGTDVINRQGTLPGGVVGVRDTWILLENVSYNHVTSSNHSDAINIRYNRTQDVVVPEWQHVPPSFSMKPYLCACGPINPAAYIVDNSITVKAVFSASTDVSSAKIRASNGSYGQLGNIDQQLVAFSGGTSGEITFQVSDPTPSQIFSFYQDWHWYCEDINGSGSDEALVGISISKIFMVLDQPQAPWATSGQSEPWVAVLQKSCAWAWGTTTAAMAAEPVTQHLFIDAGGLYDIYNGAAHYGYPNFNLTGFLNNFPSVGVVNCYDMGKAVVSFANVIGCGLNYRYSSPFGYLNCIYAIGRGWTNNPFYGNSYFDPNPIVDGDWGSSQGRSGFGNHAFGGISDNIFDACLTVDTDSDPDYGPPFTETWMIDEPWSGYKAKVVDNYPATSTGYPSTISFSVY